jgi:hypothetical protein
MPTYLKLCQDVHRFCQIQGSFVSVNESGLNGEIAALVSAVWKDIQKIRKNWLFMRKETTSRALVVGTAEYDLSFFFPIVSDSDVSRWRTDYGSLILTDPTSGKKWPLPYMHKDIFDVKFLNSTENAAPTCWTYDPVTLAVYFSSPVDMAYLVTIGYYRTVQVLGETDTPNTEVPHFNSDWHDIIVYKAICDFSAGKSILGLNQKYEVKYAKAIGELLRVACPAERVQLNPIA